MSIQWKLLRFDELGLQSLYNVLALRQEVFVVEQDCPYLDADGKDQLSHHLLGFEGEALVAYARLVPGGTSFTEPSIGRILTSHSGRGKGYGKDLMTASIDAMEKLFGRQNIRISAQVYLDKFYKDFGFVPEGEEYLEDGIPHREMLYTFS